MLLRCPSCKFQVLKSYQFVHILSLNKVGLHPSLLSLGNQYNCVNAAVSVHFSFRDSFKVLQKGTSSGSLLGSGMRRGVSNRDKEGKRRREKERAREKEVLRKRI